MLNYTIRKLLHISKIILLLTVLFSHLNCSSKNNTGPDATAIASNNRGVALMGQFKYEAAGELFEQLTRKYPNDWEIKVNLAIAILNRQSEGDDQKALSILKRVLEHDPTNLRARYCCGLLEMHMGRLDKAFGYFQGVIESDPEDEEALYFAGKCLIQLSSYKDAFNYFKRAITGDPYLSSAYYGAIMALRHLGRSEEAMSMMDEFQRLKENPRSRLVEFKYTRMGRKAEAAVINSTVAQTVTKPEGPLFESVRPLADNSGLVISGEALDADRSSITICDVNGDSRLDIFICGVGTTPAGSGNVLLLAGQDKDKYMPATQHPLTEVSAVNAALWGDVNNDGLVDVYLCRQGANQLWLQVAKDNWQNNTEQTRTAGGDYSTVDGAMFDADHDGDLDLFLVNINGPNELLNNNRDGTFEPIAEDHGLSGNGIPSKSVLITDFDSDRDADIIVINTRPPHEVYRNGRLWEYSQANGFAELCKSEIIASVAGDIDTDGHSEIYTIDSNEELSRWQRSADNTWQSVKLTKVAGAGTATKTGQISLAITDVDGDGKMDLAYSSRKGLQISSPGETGLTPLFSVPYSENTKLATWTVMASKLGPSIVGWAPGLPPSIWQPGPGRHSFVAMMLSGRKDEDSSWRSNASGIGAELSVRVGPRWTVLETFRNTSGPGQSLQPVMVGLGGAAKADFAAINWSDGVFQTELDLKANTLHHITETQRQLSSCPVLFAWNGTGFEFVSDILGVGGLGYALGPGEYAEPRPRESFMLPPGLPRPENGRLIIKLAEPMEEITYLDAVRLVAYDLPPDWSMTLDERMGVAGPAPTGKPLFYRKILTPQKAVNDRQNDVTDTVLYRDLQAAPSGPVDGRFIGRLTNEHVLTVTFPGPLDRNQGKPIILADGWVEYPYSQTNFAAWQAGADYRAPTVEILKPDGLWHKVLEQFGYPAGMPRQMTVPLPQLPDGVNKIRISTNQEIYWDRLVIAFEETCSEVQRHELKLAAARLETIGFPGRTDGPQRLPQYNFRKRQPVWDTRYMEGYYTRFGPVDELVDTHDDAVAIFGPGESVHMEFEDTTVRLKPQWSRVYVIEALGWCKDMDLYTRNGGTVGPMPASGKSTKCADHLHQTYNTRYQTGLQ